MSKIQMKITDPRILETMPSYVTEGSAAFDLRACLEAPLVLEPNQVQLIDTGVSIFMADPSMAAMILPRSGLGHKNGIVLGNLVGLIDSDYQGNLKVSCWNRSQEAFTINPLDRIAQLVIVPILRPEFQIVTEYSESNRGVGGFGSSGIK